MTLMELPTADRKEHDGFQLQGGHLPDSTRDEIIALHTNRISEQSRRDFEWKEGKINPKVVLVADYVNRMFEGNNGYSQVVSYSEVENAYSYHFSLMERDPYAAVTLTALSALSYAADVVTKRANGSTITSYLCQNETELVREDKVA